MTNDRTPGEEELRQMLGEFPTPVPSADIVERHHAQLRAEMERTLSAGTTASMSTDKRRAEVDDASSEPSQPPGRRNWARVLSAAAVVLLVASSAVVVSLLSSRNDRRGITTDRSTGTTSSAPSSSGATDRFTCGAAPPQQVVVPEGFSGPRKVPVTDAPSPSEGQLVLSWSSRTEDIELRWPADPDVVSSFLIPPPASGPATPTESSSLAAPQQVGSGRYRNYFAYRLPTMAGSCQILQLSVFGADAATVTARMEAIGERPFVL